MIKLVAIDIDNTITQSDGTITETTLESIRNAYGQGIKIALVSARPPQGINSIAMLLGIDVYRVAYLGAVIQMPDLHEIQRLTIQMGVARDIARFADTHGLSITLNIGDVEYQTQNAIRPSMAPRVTLDLAERALEKGLPPVIIATTEYEPSILIYNYCLKNHPKAVYVVRHVNSGGSYISTLVVHPEAEKGKSLLKLCRTLSIPPDEVMAIGDSESDVTMFKVSGFSVAVNNSDANVAKTARLVAPFSYGEGVKWAIDTIALPR